MKTRNSIKGSCCAVLTALFLLLTSATQAQTLTTDRSDYAPGDQVGLSGTGFSANETVTLQVLHADGSGDNDSSPAHDPWDVTSDDAGNISATWDVPADEDEAGATLIASASQSSGAHAEATFTDTPNGTGVVTVTANGGSCLGFTAAVGAGPDNWEVIQGGSYTMTITGVTECTGDAITVFVQNSNTGNFCFTATGGSGTYSGTFSMPNPACLTSPISYKCGAGQSCNNSNTYNANGPSNNHKVHLRASTFDGSCNRTGDDTNCELDCPPVTCSVAPTDGVECGSTNSYSVTVTGCDAPTIVWSIDGDGEISGATDGTSVDVVAAKVCSGSYTITATISCGVCPGTTCSQTISVSDNTNPELSGCPNDTSVECYADVPQPADVTATDACSGDLVPSFDEQQTNSGSSCNNIITRKWTATDNCGHSVSCTQTITVNDHTKPSITCPSNITVCDGEQITLGEPSTSDNCDQELEVTNDAPTTFAIGTTVVMWIAKDDCGNADTCYQSVIVTDCGECEGFRTETQGGWGADPHGDNNGVYVHANFDGAFPGGVTIGCTGATLTLTSAQAVTDFLPSTTTPTTLPAGAMVDPGNTYHNVLAGQLMTLALTLGFDLYDPDFSVNTIHLEDLFVVNGPFAGMTVGQVFAIANDVIGGCSNAYTPSQINGILDSINNNYDDGKQDLGDLTCAAPCQCEPPTNITTTSIGNDQIQVCWDAKRCARGYTLQYQWKGHSNWLTINVTAPEHCAIIDLKGHTYVTVRVSTTCGDGSVTDYASNVVYKYTAPCVIPSHLSTTNITSTSATFNWTPGTVTSSQKVRYQVVGQAASIVKSVGKTATTYTATGLTPSTSYKWKVKGDCWSAYLKFNTAAQKLDNLGATEGSITNLALYPNPADDHVIVSFNANVDENASFDIYNATGVLMAHADSREFAAGQSAQVEFNTSQLAAGIYFIHVITNDQVLVRKFVVTR